MHAADACGREPAGWPKFTGQWVVATTAVGDVDGDDKLDVVVNSRAGWLYAWNTEGRSDGVVAWESFHHDNHNTGYAGTPLEQGKLQSGVPPLPLDADGACLLPESDAGADAGANPASSDLEPSGGCACRVGRGSSSALWLLALALPAALALRRRRRGS